MQKPLNILMAQINPIVGDIDGNRKKIIHIIKEYQDKHDLIVFPELALTGYPPEDLLFRKEFHEKVMHDLVTIQKEILDCFVIVGHPTSIDDHCYNSMSILHQGNILKTYHKQNLPNYEVFDEARYFTAGPKEPCILEINDQRIGFCICEDLWQPGPVEDLLSQNISVLVSINASPFDFGKYHRRVDLLSSYARQGVSVIYVNQICGQDELLFDGQSLALDNTGEIKARAKAFEEELCSVTIDPHQVSGSIAPLLDKDALIYKGLVCGTKDYLRKNHIKGALIGLSGGIDSALTLCIAVDALGAENVHAVLMPSRYTASMSLEDAIEQIQVLNVSHSVLSIEPAFKTILDTLESTYINTPTGTSEENIQARIRGLLLMALSNKTGKIVLTTSNKSESAVGYATLYGDMAGGLAVLKDVLKTQVYALAQYRNSISKAIPDRVIQRAPSAELKPNQTDQDDLPSYPILDAIIIAFMDENKSYQEIIDMGYNPKDVNKILKLVKMNEYKRRQSAPGIKISPTAFGKDWRYPISSGFHFDKKLTD